MNKDLTPKEQEAILEIARNAIIATIRDGRYDVEPREEKSLNVRGGCFVTIKRQGELRGCIGNFQSQQPLFKEVAEMAVNSATKDPRFYPMQENELDDFDLEISVLSPLEKIEDTEEIEVGKHGIYLEKGIHRGVLLPQVAVEHGWDRMNFLKQTCIKAGLPTESWQAEDAEIYIFSAQIFSNKQA
ncbi:MAG: AMMECR1 domain-containing protein [Desulfuromonas sp.]|nr:MAG: AMMECR1 domain-containing protein [Desulfuromonas sp.]